MNLGIDGRVALVVGVEVHALHGHPAVVLAGGRGSRLGPLTDWRAKPAVPFGGKFRIIDFTLSNCLNSGIRRISILTQYKAHSLIRHLQRGWNFFRPERNETFDILPASQRVSETMWYAGTADAVYQNIDIIESEGLVEQAAEHEGDLVLERIQMLGRGGAELRRLDEEPFGDVAAFAEAVEDDEVAPRLRESRRQPYRRIVIV